MNEKNKLDALRRKAESMGLRIQSVSGLDDKVRYNLMFADINIIAYGDLKLEEIETALDDAIDDDEITNIYGEDDDIDLYDDDFDFCEQD